MDRRISVLLIAVQICVALDDSRNAQITHYEFDNTGLGPYYFRYETSDGTKRQEEGSLIHENTEHESVIMKGQYSYFGDDGVEYIVKYTADENGFHPEGDHFKVPPFVPWNLHHHHEEQVVTGERVRDAYITEPPKIYSTPPPPTYLTTPKPTPTTYLPSSPTPPKYFDRVQNDFITTQKPPSSPLPAVQTNFPSQSNSSPIYLPSTPKPSNFIQIVSNQPQNAVNLIRRESSTTPSTRSVPVGDLDPSLRETITKFLKRTDGTKVRIEEINQL